MKRLRSETKSKAEDQTECPAHFATDQPLKGLLMVAPSPEAYHRYIYDDIWHLIDVGGGGHYSYLKRSNRKSLKVPRVLENMVFDAFACDTDLDVTAVCDTGVRFLVGMI